MKSVVAPSLRSANRNAARPVGGLERRPSTSDGSVSYVCPLFA